MPSERVQVLGTIELPASQLIPRSESQSSKALLEGAADTSQVLRLRVLRYEILTFPLLLVGSPRDLLVFEEG